MSVLGFSHMVTEVEDIGQSLSFYAECGYTLQYVLEQEVPEIKQVILSGRPTVVKVYYLKHNRWPRMGIELIQHDNQNRKGNKDTLVYGHLESDGNLVLFKDGQQVSKFGMVKKNGNDQHIFMPTAKAKETKEFYCKYFHLKEALGDDSPQNYYDEIFPGAKPFSVLELASSIVPAWNALLHIVEIERQQEDIFLNNFGFSCFCFIVNDEELEKYRQEELNIVGPMSAEKTIDDLVNKFEIGFIKDPNGFFVEFYIPR